MNFPPHRPPGVKTRRAKVTAASRLTAHPQLCLESAKVGENLVHFSIVFSALWKNTLVHLLPGLSKYNI